MEPVGDLAARLQAWRLPVLLGELPALHDGGDVGAIGGDDRFEDVAGFGEVVGVGDDVDAVVVATAGHRDVQAATGGRRAGQGDRGGLGGGLGAVLGGRVPEPHMLERVLGRQGHRARPGEVGDGQVTCRR